jgi:Poly(ADP-ribose) polymerase catalytic domain
LSYLREYITKGRSGSSMKNFIANIYAIERKNERANIQAWDKYGNKMLLWHGTRAENLVGILQTGFRIAPKEATRSGSLFGEGIYFADVFNKSYQYTSATKNYKIHTNRFGTTNLRNSARKYPKRYMFLCEVMLGNQMKFVRESGVTDIPNDMHQSVMGYGRIGPNPRNSIFLPTGSIVPLGDLEQNPHPEWADPKTPLNLSFNEYVVYDTTQVRIKYIIECRDL